MIHGIYRINATRFAFTASLI